MNNQHIAKNMIFYFATKTFFDKERYFRKSWVWMFLIEEASWWIKLHLTVNVDGNYPNEIGYTVSDSLSHSRSKVCVDNLGLV